MTTLYIYRPGPWQLLTRYWQPYLEMWITTAPRKTYHCHECGDKRQVRCLEISVDYDRVRLRCKGDKHPGWV